MKYTIPAVMLAMFLAVGCAENPMTRFEYGAIRLEAGGRVTQNSAVAMADFKPGIYYCPDTGAKQVMIEVKLLEARQTGQSILGAEWFDGSNPLIAASNITNTTPKKSPPMGIGGLVNIGIGGGRGRGGCPHGPGCTTCETDSGGVGGGLKVPVGVGTGGKDSENVTSLRITFDLGVSVDLESSFLALTIQLGLNATGGIISQPVLLPIVIGPLVKEPNLPKRNVTTTVTIGENQTIVIGGLLEGQTENDIKEEIPFLADIPLLGSLFKNKNYKTEPKNLLIFVTPYVVINKE